MLKKNMDKISCIILNYNDAATTLALVEKIREYRILDSIVIVDNHSTDDSWERLGVLKGLPKLYLVKTQSNRGYGAGNQEGINFACANLKADYCIIANPDIHVTERCILRLKEALDHTEKGAVASARVKSPKGEALLSYWTLLPLWKDLLDTGLITRRLMKPLLNTPFSRLARGGDENCRLVDAVPGSFFMIRLGVLTPREIREFFDRNIFLYYEEKALGQKLKELGLKTLLVIDESYIHAHSVSIDKSYRRLVDKQRLLHRSKMYYYRTYLKTGSMGLRAARVFLDAVLAEVWFLTAFCRLGWQR